jgi:hypothetical protein
MPTIFSHIIQKKFSAQYEDVATDALAYLIKSSPGAHRGMMKLLRALVPKLPELCFKTQQAAQKEEGTIRPDMWGFAESGPRVFVENKFWAGLTDNQPVAYLEELAKCAQPSILLVVAPKDREHTLWSELQRRLHREDIKVSHGPSAASVTTQHGSILALTSWANVLSVLEHETVDEPSVRADLVQLRALCDAADSDAFTPVSGEELSNQRTPALILQMSSIVNAAFQQAKSNGILNNDGLLPQRDEERIGRYARFGRGKEQKLPIAWLGIHFRLWRKHGTTPLWVVFHDDAGGQARVAEAQLASWASAKKVLAFNDDDGSHVVALDIPAHEEEQRVVEAIVDRLQQMFDCFNAMQIPKPPVSSNE